MRQQCHLTRFSKPKTHFGIMSTWVAKFRERCELRLSRLCWVLAALSSLLALIVLLFIPELSVLSQPDGTRFFYIDRQWTCRQAILPFFRITPCSHFPDLFLAVLCFS
jgi:hypothetical protein